MKRKLKIGIISITISLLVLAGLPESWAVDGTTARLEWRGSETVNMGSNLTINVWGAGITGSKLMTAGGKITSSDPDCLSFVSTEIVGPGMANGNTFAYSNGSGTSSDVNIAKAVFKAGTKACTTTINITQPKLAFTDQTKLAPSTISKTITVKAPNSDATLKTLSPNAGTLSPVFNPNTTNYTVSGVPASTGTLNFNLAVTDPKAGVASGRTCNLSSKVTTCNIVVKAEDGTTKTYSVVVTKNDPDPVIPSKNNDSSLKSLSATGYTLVPGFTPNNKNYTLEAASNAKSIKFNAVPNHDKASIVSGETCDLTDKTTTCNIVVKAEDGSTSTYSVAVTKRDEEPVKPQLNSDATLKSLDVSGYTLSPRFDGNTTSYTMTVKNNINSLNVNATPNDPKAKVTVTGNSGWKEGNNVIRITVTAENGSEKVYIVNVNKKGNEEKVSNKSTNNFLSSLFANDGEIKPGFDKNTTSYTIKVPNEVVKLDLDVKAEDSKASVIINGNDNLKEGMNVITIEVTAEDGSLRVYTLNVERSEKVSQNKLKNLFIPNGELSPKFAKDIYEYDFSVSGNIKKLDIEAIPEFENSTVEIIGNDNLQYGNNAILIKVTDEFGFVQYYRLNVNKTRKTFLGLPFTSWMAILGTLLIVGLLLWILLLLLKKKKQEEPKPVPAMIREEPSSPVIEFKPEFNFGSKNGTDDDIVEAGGTLNQYTGYPTPDSKFMEAREIPAATYKEVPYDPYDENVTKDEMFDALNEAIETKDPAKLQILYEQEKLNRKKEALKRAEEEKMRERERMDRYK